MNLVPYQFEGNQIRVVDRNGAPHFVATDVARALGYTNPSKAIHDHCRGERIVTPFRTAGGEQQVRLIAEPDLYRLIVGSHLPAAQQFERWVFELVLPEARRRAAPPAPQHNIPRSLPEALRLAADLAEDKAALEATIAQQAPKVEALDRIASADGALSLSNAAKALQMAPRAFNKRLHSEGWIFRRSAKWIPHQHRIDQGYMVLKVGVHRTDIAGERAEHAYEQALVTPRGLARLARIFSDRAEATAQRAIGQCAQALA